MKLETINKPSCIVDFNNQFEIDEALSEINFNTENFISFENSYKKSINHINSLKIN